MSTSRLPDREQRILNEIERALSRDRRLARRLRAARRRRRPDLSRVVRYSPRPWTVAVLLAVAVVLLVAGIVTAQPGVICAFALVWPVSLYAGFRLLCRWSGSAGS
ncbi:DUF3040 domain-containing protein [Streptomyces anandii]|uniref:DUF3040 domain-containing protein n=1 Tax=Streptomyces anandii TaxID=285454 RepID=UPI0016731DF5|nr:DUF3040 domain-containing protein [Streptomyces anandii]GGY09305.1 hypothetical protein GCM10010510_64120 [Streptomyces anandii JCM 4720]